MQTIHEIKQHVQSKAASDEAFRSRLMSDPKGAVEAGFNISTPENFTIHVHKDSATAAHIVLPMTGRLTEKELVQAAGGYYPADPENLNPSPGPSSYPDHLTGSG